MSELGPSASVRRGTRHATARPFDGSGIAVCTLLAAIVVADASTVVRIAELRIGRGHVALGAGADIADASSGNFNGNGNRGSFNGNGNIGNFNGNGNAGSFNGNFNCGGGFGNGFLSDGNGNGKRRDAPEWCRYLENLNGRLGLPPGTIPDFD